MVVDTYPLSCDLYQTQSYISNWHSLIHRHLAKRGSGLHSSTTEILLLNTEILVREDWWITDGMSQNQYVVQYLCADLLSVKYLDVSLCFATGTVHTSRSLWRAQSPKQQYQKWVTLNANQFVKCIFTYAFTRTHLVRPHHYTVCICKDSFQSLVFITTRWDNIVSLLSIIVNSQKLSRGDMFHSVMALHCSCVSSPLSVTVLCVFSPRAVHWNWQHETLDLCPLP